MNPSQMPDGGWAEHATEPEQKVLEEAVPVSVTKPEPPSDPNKTADRITNEERLQLENFFLTLSNLQLQVEALDGKKRELLMSVKEVHTDFETYRKGLCEKYGREVGPATVNSDGTFRTQTSSLPAALASLIPGLNGPPQGAQTIRAQ